ncbi:MAG: type II toxin-antitoxin system HigB family toxin [Chloroflexi bacterium]|nr:type II toxin-antitoxin system HigB family toxin [Chloroflexota bacterium]
MHIVSLKTLRTYWETHPDAEQPLHSWYAIAKHSQWKAPSDIKAVYRSASFVGKNRVVFNIKGNTYRLIVAVEYGKGRMFIRFVGTPAEYDRIDAETI